MRLLTLLILNFRGVAKLFIDAQGHNVNIYGPNGVGKTTTEDAFLWLLFGKDSADKKDYDLIPHKPGATDPDIGCGKEPTVEAGLEYFGKAVKLKKSYIEEWPKKGEFKGQYAGSKTHYYVDDLEVKAGEYQQIVSELVDEKLFKLITNPHHFTEVLSWQERRETLIKIAGNLDVDPGKDLLTMMCGREFTKFHALAKQNVKAKQKELDGLPFAITEAKRQIPTDLPELQSVDALRADKAKLEEQLLTLKNDDSANVRRREIAQVETQIAEARNAHAGAVDVENAKFKAGIEKLEAEKRSEESLASDVRRGIDGMNADITALAIKKAKKLEEYHAVYEKQWTGSEICPTCGQAMPADEIDRARAAFNRQRSEDLERLKTEGLALKSKIDEATAAIAISQNDVARATESASTLATRIEKGRAMLKPYEFTATAEYEALRTKRDELILDSVSDGAQTAQVAALSAQIQDIQTQIDAASRVKIQLEQRDSQQKRVDDLMAQEKQINADLGTWEKAANLCDQHVKASAKALEQAVNGKFEIARFRLFSMQKNGEEAECCDVVYPNGSTNLSTGERLQSGVDVINTLTEFYGVNAPIWIDNAEGVTLPVETCSQIVRMVVSDADKKLRVEVVA